MDKMVCCRCGGEKDVEQFSFKNKKNNIRNSTCKECFKTVRRTWYLKYKKQIIEKNTRNRNKNIEWFKEYRKKLKCIKCGENHISCLEFHHKNPKNKEYNVSSITSGTYGIETIMKEIKKCDVLCANCHRKEHYKKDNVPVV